MFKGLFKKTKYITTDISGVRKIEKEKVTRVADNIPLEHKEEKPAVPDGMWIKCDNCGQIIYKKDLQAQDYVCHSCSFHFRMTAYNRIKTIVDEGTFKELDKNISTVNALNYPNYDEKVTNLNQKNKMKEAVITGSGKINGEETIIAVMDSHFMMGSMGSVVGEKITRAIENATKEKLPIIIFCASGGARMQEGIFSLMQMAKTSAAVARHSEEGLLYISVLTDPTTGGVTASFATLGDIILAEHGALIGFAGPRVIEQTIKQKLPEGFQRAEFLLEHGYIDKVVQRSELKKNLSDILKLHR